MFELKRKPPNPLWFWKLYKENYEQFSSLLDSSNLEDTQFRSNKLEQSMNIKVATCDQHSNWNPQIPSTNSKLFFNVQSTSMGNQEMSPSKQSIQNLQYVESNINWFDKANFGNNVHSQHTSPSLVSPGHNSSFSSMSTQSLMNSRVLPRKLFDDSHTIPNTVYDSDSSQDNDDQFTLFDPDKVQQPPPAPKDTYTFLKEPNHNPLITVPNSPSTIIRPAPPKPSPVHYFASSHSTPSSSAATSEKDQLLYAFQTIRSTGSHSMQVPSSTSPDNSTRETYTKMFAETVAKMRGDPTPTLQPTPSISPSNQPSMKRSPQEVVSPKPPHQIATPSVLNNSVQKTVSSQSLHNVGNISKSQQMANVHTAPTTPETTPTKPKRRVTKKSAAEKPLFYTPMKALKEINGIKPETSTNGPQFVNIALDRDHFVDFEARLSNCDEIIWGTIFSDGNTNFRKVKKTKRKKTDTEVEPEVQLTGIGIFIRYNTRTNEAGITTSESQLYYLPISASSTRFVVHPQELLASLEMLMKTPVKNSCFNAQEQLKYLALKVCKDPIEEIATLSLMDNLFDPLVACWLLNPDTQKEVEFDEVITNYKPKSMLINVDAFCFVPNEPEPPMGPVSPFQRFMLDIRDCYMISENLKKLLQSHGMTSAFLQQEMPVIPILCRMHMLGIGFDRTHLLSFKKNLLHRMEELKQEAYKIAGRTFLLSSPQQVSKVLYQELGVKRPAQSKKGVSVPNDAESVATGEDVLSELEHPLAKIILGLGMQGLLTSLEYRKYQKLVSTYIEPVASKARKCVKEAVHVDENNNNETVEQEQWRMHTTWLLTDIATGRIQSIDPNMQNVPKGDVVCILPETHEEYNVNIRNSFVAKPDHVFLSADYREMELRILAHICEDPKLVNYFVSEQYADFFMYLASYWLNKPMESVDEKERARVKGITYGAIYGSGPKALGQRLGVETEEAAKLMKSFFYKFPRIQEFKDQIIGRARNQGFITTLAHRKRLLQDINSTDGKSRSYSERQAVNSVIQGTGADLVKRAMIRVTESFRKAKLCKGCGLVLSIHDELLFEVPKSQVEEVAHIIKYDMEHAFPLNVPLKVQIKIGERWGSMAAYEFPNFEEYIPDFDANKA